jgi:hypothetical protein
VSGIVDGSPLLRRFCLPVTADLAIATLGVRDADHGTQVAGEVDLADHRRADPHWRRARRTRLALLKETQ